ncbi:flagellar hook-associated protein FlgK [Paenarthrobacter sp. PH39-S1]|uniref:flagellar hook-associated protein FlgK n=1 Tax=Paenarthrobacter sp. PH39-S1 TaxID=3046204 RepID=UPI0024BBB8DB|nr:flagellar hook-associated protein FlgK [Paenarthrobacter sp. PH39-S1]MDJ0355970.1 flagellar hook-associated protein FlgK [Paenarthrobacter sp. PH39-S1]
MSTFGALNAAFSGLTAAQQGLSVTGQNIANANTAGYTRQRVTTSAIGEGANVGLFSAGARAGQGVSVDGVARLGDTFLDARVRSTTAAAGYTAVRSNALTTIEDSTHEPGAKGISAKLQAFWAGWGAMANQAGEAAPAAVLLAAANDLAGQLAVGYGNLEAQWSQGRSQVDGMATDLNNAAAQVADLNLRIRSTIAAGGSANEMVDQRSQLTATIASLAGGAVRDTGDGMVDVLVGGNAMVSGGSARTVQVTGAYVMDSAGAGTGPARTYAVQLEWTDRTGAAGPLDGGEIAGALSVLAPAGGGAGDAAGTGGSIAEAAASYNTFAQKLADAVNTAHRAGVTTAGTAGGDFFDFSPGKPSAQGLTVAVTDVSGLATGSATGGALNGGNADAISQLGVGPDSPDTAWSGFITKLGAASRSAQQQGQLAAASAVSATQLQASTASVSLNEENMNLLSYQHAYQAAARVMTAVDEMLDVLINRTGLVGR